MNHFYERIKDYPPLRIFCDKKQISPVKLKDTVTLLIMDSIHSHKVTGEVIWSTDTQFTLFIKNEYEIFNNQKEIFLENLSNFSVFEHYKGPHWNEKVLEFNH